MKKCIIYLFSLNCSLKLFKIESRVPSITPECTTDSDCPSQHACVNQRCQNPCAVSVLCSPDQECHVQDTVPYRTVMCQCRPDTVATIDGHCKPIGNITYIYVLLMRQYLLKIK